MLAINRYLSYYYDDRYTSQAVLFCLFAFSLLSAWWPKQGCPESSQSERDDYPAGAAVKEAKVTKDALFEGRLMVWQPAQGAGYRTNVDAILLAAFAATGKARVAVDLGAGVGAVGLTLLSFGAAARRDVPREGRGGRRALQAQPEGEPIRRARRRARRRFRAPLEATARTLVHTAQLVVANPPYVTPARDGRRSADRPPTGRLAGRQGSLAPFVRAAAAALGRRGRACFVYPAHALLELTALARQSGLEPKRARFVHGKADRPARVALVELARAKPGEGGRPPALVEVGDDGKPTSSSRPCSERAGARCGSRKPIRTIAHAARTLRWL